MKDLRIGLFVLTIIALSTCLASVAGAAATRFEITAPQVKVAGDCQELGNFSVGQRNVVLENMPSGDTRIFTTYQRVNRPGEIEVRLGISLDGGTTWRNSQVIAHGDIAGDDIWGKPGLALGPDVANPGSNILHVVWLDWAYENDTWVQNLRYARGSVNNDGEWTELSSTIVSNGEHVSNFGGAVAADGAGGVHIVYYGLTPNYSKSVDSGLTFTNQIITGASNARSMAIDVDSTGNAYVAWDDNSNHDVQFTKYPFTAAPVSVASSYTGWHPSIEVVDNNNIYVTVGSDTSGLYVAKTSDGGTTWNPNFVSSKTGWDTSLVADVNGNVAVLWYDDTETLLSKSADGAATWGKEIPIGNADTRFGSLVMNPAGKVGIVFSEFKSPGYSTSRGLLNFTAEW